MAPESPRNPLKLWLQPGGAPPARHAAAGGGRWNTEGGGVLREGRGGDGPPEPKEKTAWRRICKRQESQVFRKVGCGSKKNASGKAIRSRLPFHVRGADGDTALPNNSSGVSRTGLCANHHHPVIEPSLDGLGGIPLTTQGRKRRQGAPRKLEITIFNTDCNIYLCIIKTQREMPSSFIH